MNAQELLDLYHATARCAEFCKKAVALRLVESEHVADIVWHVLDNVHDKFTLTANVDE